MHRIALLVAAASAMAGCQSSPVYTADLSFSKAPGLGYWNTGLLPAGRLYLWDTHQNRLTLISDSVELTKQNSGEPPTALTSSNIQGISVEGSFGSSEIKSAVTAEVGRQIEFQAEGVVRERYGSIYTGLAKAYAAEIAEGNDVATHWSIADATRAGSGLYYVVISGIVRADKTSVTQKGLKDNTMADITVTVPGSNNSISLKVINGNTISCAGASSSCFFELTVLKPYINAQKRLDFAPARDADLTQLPSALRGL